MTAAAESPATSGCRICPTASRAEVHVHEFRGREGLERIRGDWGRVLGTLGRERRFHHLPEWSEARLAARAAEDVRFFVMVRGESPVGIFPLQETTVKRMGVPLRALTIPHSGTGTYADFVFEPAEENATLVARLVDHLGAERGQGWDVLHLARLLDDSSALYALRRAPPPRTAIAADEHCHVVRCLPLEALERRLSKNFRANLRKARNRLQATGARAFLTTRDPALLPAFLEKFVEVEASGWKGDRGTRTSTRHRPGQLALFRAVATHLGRVGACEINLLEVDGRCIAGQFCFLTGGTTYLVKVGYDERYARLAPGHMLLEDLFRRSEEEGRALVDLMSDADWHADWKPADVPVFHAYVFNATPRGLCALAGLKARAWLARLAWRVRLLSRREGSS